MPDNDQLSETPETRLEVFAALLSSGSDGPAESARERGWLDENGKLTQDGRAVLKALNEQRNTRTALRNLP